MIIIAVLLNQKYQIRCHRKELGQLKLKIKYISETTRKIVVTVL